MTKPFVMLVDDEIPFVDTMVKRFEKRELIVISAFNGQETLDMLAKNRNLDIVVLD